MSSKNGYNDRSVISYSTGVTVEGKSTCWYSLTAGDKVWKDKEGLFHRVAGPAVELDNLRTNAW